MTDFKAGGVRLVNGDCLEILPGLADGSVDMVLADLPYACLNKSNRHAQWDREISMDALWPELLRVCRENAAIVLFGQGLFSARLMMSRPSLYRYSLVWDKVRTTGFLNANRAPLRRHEDILVFYRRQPVYNPQKRIVEPHLRTHSRGARETPKSNSCYGNMRQLAQDGTSCEKFPTSILRFQKKHKDWCHPTEKDVPLLEYLIRTYTNEGDCVLDCAAGSFSTMVACVNTGRRGVGIELMPEYYEIGIGRVKAAIKEKDDGKEDEEKADCVACSGGPDDDGV